MIMRSIVVGIGIMVATCAVTLAQVNSNVGVSAYAQGRGTPCTGGTGKGCGGCYPAPIPGFNPLSELPKVNPEWAAVGPMIQSPGFGADSTKPPGSVPVRLNGTVRLTKVNIGGDFPGSHITDDQNTFLELDPGNDAGHLATGNDPAGCNDEGCNLMEMEREIGKYPLFAWAGEGDRITALGRWIFDCGHPDPDPGHCSNNVNKSCLSNKECGSGNTCIGGVGGCTVSGNRCISAADCASGQTCTNPPPNFNYRAEMHPPQAIVVYRNKSIGKLLATQANVFISSDSGGAGDICTVDHLAADSDVLFNKDCFLNHCSVTTDRSCTIDKDCAGGEKCLRLKSTADLTQRVTDINAADFTFDMPLPPPPSDTATLKITTKSFKPAGGQMPKPTFVIPTPPLGPTPVLHVVVPMTAPLKNGKLPDVFAERITAGWNQDTTPLTHVKVKFVSVTINNPLKDATPTIAHVCTLPAGGLSLTGCLTDKDCPASVCQATSKPCNTDRDCGKTDHCANGASHCVGGTVPGWDVWSEVNGDWIKFKNLDKIGAQKPFLAPPYVQPSPTPLMIAQGFKFDEYVQAGESIHIATTGHSVNCIDTMYGTNLKSDLSAFGLSAGGACLGAGDYNPGRIEVTHSGAGFATVSGATCTPSGTVLNCSTTPLTGDGGTCASHPTNLCVDDKGCALGACGLGSGAPCHADGDCSHCSVTTATACSANADCPKGTCSNNALKACNVTADCTSPGVCNGGETCVSNADTCTGFETCTPTGSGAFTLNYTLEVK